MLKRICRYLLRQHKIRKQCKQTHSEITSKVVINLHLEKEGNNWIGSNCVIYHVSIGKYSYIGQNSAFQYTEIGRYCSIGESVTLLCGRHPTRDYVSTHPMFYSERYPNAFAFQPSFEEKKYVDEDKKTMCKIGNDVWIGSFVKILGGVTIGDGAIVGAGAVVVEDVPPYAICVGVPAKIIRYRFNEEQINKLNKLQWWNQDDKFLRKYGFKFSNIEELFGELEKTQQ